MKKGLIFAAGKGTRLRPLTLTTPKPLIKINGTPMIETIITAMIANGIKEIYIVLGYKKENFYYLKEKYSEVKFLYNPDYETRNTISSFYHAIDILDDDIVISEGDLYISDYSIFNTNVVKTTYLYQPDQLQNNEWGFKIDFLTNNVLEIRKPEEKVFLNNNLYGVSFWKKEDLLKLTVEISNNYNEKKYENSAYDELINNFIDKVEIGVRPVNSKQIIEVDSLDELFNVDSSYNIFKSLIMLENACGVKRDEIVGIYDNPGRSLNNYNYIVETKSNKYIVRIPGVGTELFSDRYEEKKAYEQLKETNLVEQNYYLDPVSGIKISKYYDESRTIDATNVKELSQLMVTLKKLHEGDYSFKPDNVFDRIKKYDAYVARVGGRKYYSDEFINLQNTILKEEKQFEILFENKPIHGDLSPNNVIVSKGEIILIDLEFMSMGDPYTDLATFSHDGNYSPNETIELLNIYLGRKATNNEILKLLTLCSAVSIMWYSWAVFKMAVEEQERPKYKEYRDIYLEYAKIMHDAAKKYNI